MKKSTLKFLLLILLFIPQRTLYAQWTANSNLNSTVSDVVGFEEATPLQASTPGGKTYISYFEDSATGYLMKLQLLDENGNKLFGSGGLLVSNHSQNSFVSTYDLKVDQDGNAILAFQDIRNGDQQVFAYKIDSTGSELWGADGITLHTDGADYEVAPSIGILSNNDIVIAWIASDASNNQWIPYQKISSSGSIAWSMPLSVPYISKCTQPVVLGTYNEEFIIVYIDQVVGFYGTLKADKFDAAGAPVWNSPSTVSSYTTSVWNAPLIEADFEGGCFIGFNTGNPLIPTQNDVFIQYVKSDGTKPWPANGKEASNSQINHKEIRDITYKTSDNWLYIMMKVLDQNQNGSGVYAQALDTTGADHFSSVGWQLVNIGSATAYAEPYAWTDANDGFIGLYAIGTQAGNVQLRSFKMDYFNGIPLWDRLISDVSSPKSNASSGVSFYNNQAIFVWEDERVDRGIYTQNISGQGNIGIVTGIDQKSNENSLANTFFVNGILDVNLCNNLPCDFYLFSVDGKLLIQKTLKQSYNLIDLNQFAEGTYIFQMNSGKNVQSGKLVKLD